MSWTTGLQTEGLAANSAVGSAQNTFTSAQTISPVSAAAYLPSNFYLPSYGVSKTVLVKAFGVLSTTSTPNFTIGVSANTTQGTYNGSGILAVSPTTAMPSSVTNVPWELDVLITCASTGASGSFLSDGQWKLYGTTTSVVSLRVSSSTANPNTAYTLSTEVAYYVELFAAWGTSNSANSVTVYNVATLGIN